MGYADELESFRHDAKGKRRVIPIVHATRVKMVTDKNRETALDKHCMNPIHGVSVIDEIPDELKTLDGTIAPFILGVLAGACITWFLIG